MMGARLTRIRSVCRTVSVERDQPLCLGCLLRWRVSILIARLEQAWPPFWLTALNVDRYED